MLDTQQGAGLEREVKHAIDFVITPFQLPAGVCLDILKRGSSEHCLGPCLAALPSRQELADNPPSAAFVATLGHQVVGVFAASRALCTSDEVATIRSEFHVEDSINFDRHRLRNQAMVTALAMNPIFTGQCRFVLKEVGGAEIIAPLSHNLELVSSTKSHQIG